MKRKGGKQQEKRRGTGEGGRKEENRGETAEKGRRGRGARKGRYQKNGYSASRTKIEASSLMERPEVLTQIS